MRTYKAHVVQLREQIQRLKGDTGTLIDILKEMKRDHNENYHDMAVKNAIAGYDEFMQNYEKQGGDEESSLDDLEFDTADEEETATDDAKPQPTGGSW